MSPLNKTWSVMWTQPGQCDAALHVCWFNISKAQWNSREKGIT